MRACWLVAWVIGFSPAKAAAYRTVADQLELDAGTKVAWSELPIELELFAREGDPVDRDAMDAALLEAIALWDGNACAARTFEIGAAADAPAVGQDGRNTVQWVHEGWDAYGDDDAIATTETLYMGHGDRFALIEADIYLNASTFTWDAARIATLDGVFAHELGHALGLAHPCELRGDGGAPRCEGEPMTLMHPFYDPAQLALTEDDVAGACFLYPEVMPSDASAASGCTLVRGPFTVDRSALAWCTVAIALALGRYARRRARASVVLLTRR